MEEKLINASNISTSMVGKLVEIDISLPEEMRGSKISSLSFSLYSEGERSVVLGVQPFFKGSGQNMYTLSVREDMLKRIDLMAIYDFHEKCGKEEVASKGFRYHLNKAITKP